MINYYTLKSNLILKHNEKKILLSLCGILILFIVFQKCGNKNTLDQIQIEDTDFYLTLPSGIVNKNVNDFTFGIYEHFSYSDKSFVLISTHDMGTKKIRALDFIGEKKKWMESRLFMVM